RLDRGAKRAQEVAGNSSRVAHDALPSLRRKPRSRAPKRLRRGVVRKRAQLDRGGIAHGALARDDHAESIELIGVSRRARRRSLGVLARKKIEERAETRLGDVLPIDRENARRSGAQKKIEREASGLAPLQAPRSTPAHATLAPRSR